MGSVKDSYVNQYERGWYSLEGKFVCSECFTDSVLSSFTRERASHQSCTYCGRSGAEPIAAPMDEILDLVTRSLYSEWTDPVEELPYVSRDGGYQGTTYGTYELLWDYEFPTEDDDLLSDVANSIINTLWCRRDYFSAPESKQLLYSWQDFCHAVKHETRYLFFPSEIGEFPGPDLRYTQILDEIGTLVFGLGIIEVYDREWEVYRGRVHKPEITLKTASDLASPPIGSAIYSNRMSPSGIPMFYGSLGPDTVIAEMFDETKDKCSVVTIAKFTALRPLYLVNLTSLPDVPSIFSDDERHLRAGIGFLHEFVKDLSKPIIKDGREHIEYVPSQIVTEYFRHRITDEQGHKPDGMLYPSSKQPGGTSVVVFALNEHCINHQSGDSSEERGILLLVHESIKRVYTSHSKSIECAFRNTIHFISTAVRRIWESLAPGIPRSQEQK